MKQWTKVTLSCSAEETEGVSAALFGLGAGAVEERSVENEQDRSILAFFGEEHPVEALREELPPALSRALGRLVSTDSLLVTTVTEEEWRAEWRAQLEPRELGQGFLIAPQGTEVPPGPRELLRYVPQLAFGDGSHPTTRLAAAAVEELCRARPGLTVIDVGTGNGVLAMIAARAGATQVIGLEHDPEALAAALANLQLNGVTSQVVAADLYLSQLEAAALVVANIELRGLAELLPDFAEAVLPGGTLILTGILADQAVELGLAVTTEGFTLLETREAEEWRLLMFRKGQPQPQ